QRLGRLSLACVVCRGRGWVGGGADPARRPEPPDRPPPVWEDPRWLDPMVAAASACRYCLGNGSVQHVDRDRGVMVTMACACAPPA
ncbi:hypothetical protein, partial [Nonomuraea sp. NPDC050691]|uniref:hypothetical protein n=1 Tax=Nonomuraea sp. NPDC050691 TaxID=3155661 RepID=UPI0033FD2071